jgi:beta-N-acetylhexosaminidase
VGLAGGVALGSGNYDGERDSPRSGGHRRESDASLGRLVGQVLVSSFDGGGVPAYLRRRLRAGQTAGAILFRKNAASPGAARGLTRAIQRSARGGALVAVDQEGGPVRILPFAGPDRPQPAQGGAGQVGAAARAAGRQLRAVGVNVNLAPVADLPGGPALRSRTFRGSPREIGAKVAAAARGYSGAKVAATAKHFPGLGAARVNTDHAPVTIDLRRAASAAALAPFRAAIAADVPLVMNSHALYPALDRRSIASQSRAVTTRLLRERLRFRGAVVTDSIEAEAVLRRSSVAEAARRSIAAGADLILMTGSGSWKLVYPYLLRQARRSAPFRARLAEAGSRVGALKRRLGLRVRG